MKNTKVNSKSINFLSKDNEEGLFLVRILHILSCMDRAGTETLLMNLYRNINREKVQFDFAVTVTGKCDYEDEIEFLEGKIIRYPRYTGKNHFKYVKWWNTFFSLHPEYRIVHGHIGSTAAIYLKIAKKYGIYTIAHSHSANPTINLKTLMYKIYSFPTRYIADYFMGCSMPALELRFGNKVAHNRTISVVLNNAIESDKYVYDEFVRKKIREELKLKSNEFVLGTVGRLVVEKNPFFILDVLEKLKKKKEEFKFIWVGKGELQKKIEEGIKERHLEENIIMLGGRTDVNELLQAMDLFMFPSVFEGLGIAGIESQAAGLPTLCSDKIPEEIAITNLCQFISIDNINMWMNAIQKAKNIKRTIRKKEILNAGFDINDVAVWLQKFYIRNYKN